VLNSVVGPADGETDGGGLIGLPVGDFVGLLLGHLVGLSVGDPVTTRGEADGDAVGLDETGAALGTWLGARLPAMQNFGACASLQLLPAMPCCRPSIHTRQ